MNDLESLALLGASISIFAGALLYLFSKLLNIPQLRNYAIMYILEAFLTVVLAFGLFILLGEFEKFATIISAKFYQSAGIAVAPNVSLTEMAIGFLSQRAANCYLLTYGQMMVLYGLGQSVIGKMHVGGMLAYGPSTHFVTSSIEFLLDFLFYALLMSYFLIKFIAFFSAYGPFLIALGIVIRAFEPAKSLGAYLIAVGIGFGYIFPLSLNIGEAIFYNDAWCRQLVNITNDPVYQANLKTMMGNTFEVDPQVNKDTSSLWLWFKKMQTGFINLMSFGYYIMVTMASIIDPENLTTLIYNITATTFFGPLVAFVITLSFVNIFTTALGGRISEIGRGFLKLV